MNTTEKADKLKETNGGETVQNEKKSKFKNKLIAFLKNNKAAAILSFLLLVVFIWFSVRLNIKERNFNNVNTMLVSHYESTIDSLQISHIEFATMIFSWSVRSELLRSNTENLNQLLTVFVKESGANLVQIINPEDKTVLLSSDKKYEGRPYTGDLSFEFSHTLVLKEEGIVKILTPVMGFTTKIGILLVELKVD